eukprot:101504_1
MGNLFSWIRSFWQQEMEIAVLGLQNAGKSTFIHVLNRGEFIPDMMPTIGFNMVKLNKGKVSIKVWDLGGQKRFRPMWERYCRGVDAIVYVVDSADHDKFPDSQRELHALLSEKQTLSTIPILVLSNKNDVHGHASSNEVSDALELHKLSGREVAIYSISCKKKHNMEITLNWLINHSKKS